MHIQLAWRNIWRNPRRTAVILTAVIIGVWTMLVMVALMRGVSDGMIRNAISTLTGEIQIHARGYRSDPGIDHSIRNVAAVETALLKALPGGSKHAFRIRVNAIANNARHSAGLTLVGIVPKDESAVSFIGPAAVIEGRYLKPEDKNGILVGRSLLEKFETRLGNKLVLMSQDTGGEIASRAFRILGVFKAEMEATEKQYVFVNMETARKMLTLPEGISEVCIVLPGGEPPERVAAGIEKSLGGGFEVHTWRELLSAITAYLELFDGFMLLWYVVIFIAMGFGIVNTTLMSVFERMREFGVLKALGMKPRWIVRGVLTESFFLLLLGVGVGNLISIATVAAFSSTGIDLSSLAAGAEYAGMSRIIYPALSIRDLGAANVVVFVLGLLVSSYPAVKAARFTPVEAMAHT
ncbi:MAG: ABC transporter permease [Deltaproteobacteria bacterium]|nr:ABC transporter permease [Deltaproteobacteria bacterium]